MRTMAYDRNSMELAISSAKDQRNIDMVMSVSNAVTSGGLGFALGGGAGAGALGITTLVTDIVGAELQGRLSEKTARAEQELREKNVKSQLSSTYSASYGLLTLLDNALNDGYRIIISMPIEVDPLYYVEYANEYGYQVQGVKTISISQGYHKGRLINIPINGVKGDLLNAEFIEGMKLGVIT